MQALTNRVKVVDRRPMSLWERMYLPAIFKGMLITFSHIFKKKPTINYPEKKRPFSPVFRGLQILNMTKKDVKTLQHADCVRLPARLKPLPWKRQNASQVRNICIVKKNTLQFMKSICCVAFSVDYVKKHARKKQFS